MTENSFSDDAATLSAKDEDIWESIPCCNRLNKDSFTPEGWAALCKIGRAA